MKDGVWSDLQKDGCGSLICDERSSSIALTKPNHILSAVSSTVHTIRGIDTLELTVLGSRPAFGKLVCKAA